MAKFQFNELIRPYDSNITARVADGTGTSNQLSDADVNKFVKLKGDSQFGLCAVGDEIEGFLASIESGPIQDGFQLGSVQEEGRKLVTLDGLQGTPGTGTIAVGDYVVAGTVTARGTKLPGPPKVCKATATKDALSFLWRVVSLKGTGAVGQLAVIARV
ncbi:hypothetical protein H4CHR_02972 [Variovorax sp. PBS-H4]|uniref:hypothetical protein n=1 Tax=Variovorax sp. PBS-H4 TaxID=434008 RepID=UPI001318F8F6|nr:hypothetical protein [Variovorax sp. PBS-H4]VTU32241.1 hypothetical protein H4CHR_02972 [Variovorax sp. PBS-H4]